LAEALAQLGEFPAGITHGTEGLRIAEASGHPFSMIIIHGGLAWLHLYQGTLRHAIPALERGLDVCRASDLPFRSLRFNAALGYAFAVSGRIAEALPLLTQAVAQVASERPRIRYADWLIWLAEGCLLAGRIDEAIREAAHALELARRSKQRGNEAWALRLLGEIAARREPPEFEKADASYREALALAAELGMRPLIAHCHLGLGKLYRRTGKRPEAQEHLATATTMYREMGMRFWLEQAETDMKELT
jgi:tetratricopeptide (TPR) repeat protein